MNIKEMQIDVELINKAIEATRESVGGFFERNENTIVDGGMSISMLALALEQVDADRFIKISGLNNGTVLCSEISEKSVAYRVYFRCDEAARNIADKIKCSAEDISIYAEVELGKNENRFYSISVWATRAIDGLVSFKELIVSIDSF